MFTAEVSLVSLPVTVKDAHGAPIGDLERHDFQIREAGESREVAVFERHTNRPLSIVLMLDASLSTAIELRYEKESAARFLDRLLSSGVHTKDMAAVYSFSAGVEVLADFTRAQGKLKSALGRVRPKTGTSVYDAITLASGELARRQGRRVIVVITDGGDTTSNLTYADARRAAYDTEVAIYPIIVLPIKSDAGRNRGGEHALMTLSKNSGGESFVQYGARDLDTAFDEVLRNLRTQYLVGYYPRGDAPTAEDGFRRVEVSVSRVGAVVMVRDGYYAETEKERPKRRKSTGSPVQVRPLPQTRVPPAPPPEEQQDSHGATRRIRGGKPAAPQVKPGP